MVSRCRPRYSLDHVLRIVIFGMLVVLPLPNSVLAAQETVDAYTVAVSETDYARRIYSYDMGLDSNGNIHIVYSKPFGTDASQIYYVTRKNGVWQDQVLLSANGFLDNKSTLLLIDNNDLIHVAYIKKKDTPESLYYLTISNGVASDEILVADGGWHSRMQLDDNGYPMFVRGGQIGWPNPVSKLILLQTQDGNTWNETALNLPDVGTNKNFRIADFLYANGTYHITYGDSAYTKAVVDRTRYDPPRFNSGVFHNLHYATSQDGAQWVHHLLDTSGTWYELEFWHSMVLDQGYPVVTMYKYAQYNDIYNRGTSVLLSKWDGASWNQSIITDTTYPDTSEGMGIGMVVVGPEDYYAAWDFSPDDTHDPFIRGPRGNTIMAKSRPDDFWSPRVQLDPFSLEGRVKLLTDGNHLFFLALGDYVEPRLYFREVAISDFGITPSNILDLVLPALIHGKK